MQQDVIISCIDDPDISIRLQALDLGAGMVNGDNLISVVERLMQQLLSAPLLDTNDDHVRGRVEPPADTDGEDPEESINPSREVGKGNQTLPTEYIIATIRQILEMCSRDIYSNMDDFEWYLEILLRLFKTLPAANGNFKSCGDSFVKVTSSGPQNIAIAIGRELRNVAVRVDNVRGDAVKIAETLLDFPRSCNVGPANEGVLSSAAWIAGEYVSSCLNPYSILDSLILPRNSALAADTVCAYLQATLKVLSYIIKQPHPWTTARKTAISLLVARVIHFLETLITHPNLEVQERAVEFLELIRVALHAIESHEAGDDTGPLLLTKAVPELFSEHALRPVAPSAQQKVPIPLALDLENPINDGLMTLLERVDHSILDDVDADEFENFYNRRPTPKPTLDLEFETLTSAETFPLSYQQSHDDSADPKGLKRKRFERRARNKDDPFYIGGEDVSPGASTPFHDVVSSHNGDDVDIDSIPIMNLNFGDMEITTNSNTGLIKPNRMRSKRSAVAQDETLDRQELDERGSSAKGRGLAKVSIWQVQDKSKKSLLEVDYSGLDNLSLEDMERCGEQEISDGTVSQDSEMSKALAEVERLRLEMQRDSERTQAADGAPAEGTLVKKKKKRKKISSGNVKQPPPSGAKGSEAKEHDPQDASDVVALDSVKIKKREKKPRIEV